MKLIKKQKKIKNQKQMKKILIKIFKLKMKNQIK